MASRLFYLGEDTCHRTVVLRSASYIVEQCSSVMELAEALDEEAPQAVLVSEGSVSRDLVSVAVVCVRVPLVLFRDSYRNLNEAAFDLVIPVLQPPEAWLADLGRLIETSRAVHREAQALGIEAREPCRDAAQFAPRLSMASRHGRASTAKQVTNSSLLPRA